MKRPSKKKIRIAVLIAAAAGLLCAAGYTVFIAPLLKQEKWIYKEETVQRGDLTVGVTESGSLEYGITSVLYELDLSVINSQSDDEEEESKEVVLKYLQIETMHVTSGERVKEGDALITFTEESVASVRRLLNSALIDARAQYNEAQTEYELSTLEAQNEYQSMTTSLAYAEAIRQARMDSVDGTVNALQLTLNQCNEKIASLEEAVTEAQEAYQEALTTYEAAKETMSLTGTGNAPNYFIIQTEYSNAKTRYENALNALDSAKESLQSNAAQIESLTEQLVQAKAKQTIEKLEVQYAYEEDALQGENALITYNATLESLEEELKEAEEEKNQIQELLDAFESFVGEDGTLYATQDGIVTEASYEQGDLLEQTGTLLSYAAPDGMTISVDLTQEDVVAMTVGDTVVIGFTAYPDTSYEGTILSIDTTATSRESATISYQVLIGVNGDTEALYGGMTADITFVTEALSDVCYVSRNAIVSQDGKKYVYTKDGLGGKKLTEVTVGASNGVYVEIVEGLSAGETIYIASRVSEDAAATEESGSTDESNAFGGQIPEGMEDMFGGQMPEGMEDMFGGQMPGGMGGNSGGQMPGGMGGSFGGQGDAPGGRQNREDRP